MWRKKKPQEPPPSYTILDYVIEESAKAGTETIPIKFNISQNGFKMNFVGTARLCGPDDE